MTVIARLVINGNPVLIGDLLVSGSEDDSSPIGLPTHDDINVFFPKGSGYTIKGLSQKIYIINENICIAFAGSVVAAHTLFDELRKEAKDIGNNFEKFRKFLDGSEAWMGKQQIELVGFFVAEHGIVPFSKNCPEQYDPYWGEYALIGSGASGMKRYLDQISGYGLPIESIDVTVAINLGCMIISSLIFDEMALPGKDFIHSLFNYYGGGYEIATYVNGRFQKVDDILNCVWIGKKEGDGVNLSFPSALFKNFYIEDRLYIYRVFFKQNGYVDEVPNYELNESVDIICPFYTKGQVEVDSIELGKYINNCIKSVFNSNYVFLEAEGIGYLLQDYRVNKDSPFYFTKEGSGSLRFTVDPKFLHRVRDFVYSKEPRILDNLE